MVTRPTDFMGFHVFSRFIDPWRKLWWVWSTPDTPATATIDAREPEGDGEASGDWSEDGSSQQGWEPTPVMTYIHDTLINAFPRLQDPHA